MEGVEKCACVPAFTHIAAYTYAKAKNLTPKTKKRLFVVCCASLSLSFRSEILFPIKSAIKNLAERRVRVRVAAQHSKAHHSRRLRSGLVASFRCVSRRVHFILKINYNNYKFNVIAFLAIPLPACRSARLIVFRAADVRPTAIRRVFGLAFRSVASLILHRVKVWVSVLGRRVEIDCSSCMRPLPSACALNPPPQLQLPNATSMV